MIYLHYIYYCLPEIFFPQICPSINCCTLSQSLVLYTLYLLSQRVHVPFVTGKETTTSLPLFAVSLSAYYAYAALLAARRHQITNGASSFSVELAAHVTVATRLLGQLRSS